MKRNRPSAMRDRSLPSLKRMLELPAASERWRSAPRRTIVHSRTDDRGWVEHQLVCGHFVVRGYHDGVLGTREAHCIECARG